MNDSTTHKGIHTVGLCQHLLMVM